MFKFVQPCFILLFILLQSNIYVLAKKYDDYGLVSIKGEYAAEPDNNNEYVGIRGLKNEDKNKNNKNKNKNDKNGTDDNEDKDENNDKDQEDNAVDRNDVTLEEDGETDLAEDTEKYLTWAGVCTNIDEDTSYELRVKYFDPAQNKHYWEKVWGLRGYHKIQREYPSTVSDVRISILESNSSIDKLAGFCTSSSSNHEFGYFTLIQGLCWKVYDLKKYPTIVEQQLKCTTPLPSVTKETPSSAPSLLRKTSTPSASSVTNQPIFSNPTKGSSQSFPTTQLSSYPSLTPSKKQTSSSDTSLTTIQREWLKAHNTRREDWHVSHGVSYVPLQWNEVLAEKAQIFADQLMKNNCEMEHAEGDEAYGGENLAKNVGDISLSPEGVLSLWVDQERSEKFGRNGHLTAALWRASKYVGCAISSNSKQRCHIQVCRYVATGNCNVNKKNWEDAMIADTSPCFPQVPCDSIDKKGQCEDSNRS